MGIGSESAGALKGSAPYQSPAVLVVVQFAPGRVIQFACGHTPIECDNGSHQQLTEPAGCRVNMKETACQQDRLILMTSSTTV